MRLASRLALAACAAWIVVYELDGLGAGVLPVGPVKPLHLLVMVVGGAVCAGRAVAVRHERLAWALIGAASLAWTAGETYYTYVLWTDPTPPAPSPADAGYLVFPVLLGLGLVLLVRSRIGHPPRTVWADALTAGLAVGAVSAAAVMGPVLGAVEGTHLAVATNLAYPLTDLALLGLIAGAIAACRGRADRTLILLAAGVATFWVADSVYLVDTAQGAVESAIPTDAGWWAAPLLFAFAAQTRARVRVASDADGGTESIWVPIGFAALGLGVLVVSSIHTLDPVAVALATAALVSVMVRLVLTFREKASMLATTRHEALTDSLTGLGNRRRLAVDLERALRDGGPVVLALFDLDGFKHYNDTFGHPAGDVLLERLGRRLAALAEGRGGAYRMGGDEFCVLIRPGGAPPDRVVRACALVLQERGDGFEIAASHGAVVLPDEANDVHRGLRLADQRLYASKHSGRASAGRQSRDVLVRALVERDPTLAAHAHGVAALAESVAAALGLAADDVEHVRQAAELHDVGKVAIPDGILDKPGPLDADEWAFVRRHTVIGERIVRAAPALSRAAALVRASHERWDGRGYPDKLAGEAIPLGARIVAVCDAYDAMTTERPYSAAMSPSAAIAELRRCAGTQFDPAVVEAFAAALRTPAPRPALRLAA
jgi:two-component system cell cycle response regulator